MKVKASLTCAPGKQVVIVAAHEPVLALPYPPACVADKCVIVEQTQRVLSAKPELMRCLRSCKQSRLPDGIDRRRFDFLLL